jgi:hypothetical protein
VLLASLGGSLLSTVTTGCGRPDDRGGEGAAGGVERSAPLPKLRELLAEAGPVIDVITEFRRANGYWPLHPDELPGDSAAVPARWRYSHHFDNDSDPRWELEWHDDFGYVAYRFSTRHQTENWNASYLGSSPPLMPTERPFGDQAPPSDPKTVLKKLVASRDRYPAHKEVFTKAIISLAHESGMNETAREEVDKALPIFPDPWFIAHKSISLAREKEPPPAGAVLPIEEWAARGNELTLFIRASCAYHAAGLSEQAKRCLRRALKCPQPLDEFKSTRDYDGEYWEGAVLATHFEDYGLLLDWCDSWDRYSDSKRYGGLDRFLFRAYGHLRLGEFDQADKAMSPFPLQLASTWSRGEDRLGAAVRARDRTFQFDPGPYPALTSYKFHFR